MANQETYSTDQIKKMQAHLRKLPTKDTSKTKKEVIELLDDNIKEALSKGYTLKEICDVLNQNYMKITYATLKAYLQRKKIDIKVNNEAKPKATPSSEHTNDNSNTSSFVKQDTDIDEL